MYNLIQDKKQSTNEGESPKWYWRHLPSKELLKEKLVLARTGSGLGPWLLVTLQLLAWRVPPYIFCPRVIF